MKYKFNINESHKFRYTALILLIIGLYLSNIIASMAASSAASNELYWSFDDHPHPQSHMLTVEEKNTLNSINDYRGGIELCSKTMQSQFAIYGGRFPRFEQSGAEEKRFSAWKLHLLKGDYEFESECITDELFLKILETKHYVNLVYCGIFSGIAETEQEHLFVESLEQMASYAHLGILTAMGNFISLHRPGSNLSLNPDVEFFIRKSLQKNVELVEYKYTWYTGHLEPLMTQERIEFVNAAVERGDLDAVLSSTSPCLVMPQ